MKKTGKKSAKKLELLSPAGSLEKLKYALEYGANAVYAGVPETSMRARINTFTEKSLLEAARYVHARGKKIFVTVNIYAHNSHLPAIEKHLKFLKKVQPDAVIVADPGIINLVKKYLPRVAIHLSTQANTTNWQAAKFWQGLGVKRIVLAREVTLEDIREIHRKVPKMELEYFVHGAMCMSYSGRCILSKWMTGKSANLGDCTQPCRWSYQRKLQDTRNNNQTNSKSQKTKNQKLQTCNSVLTMEVEEMQSKRTVLLEEDSHGTYFFNSRDLNLLAYLEELKKAGVTSFKIEGRNKSVYYAANVTRAYRSVLDATLSKKTAREAGKIYRWASKELDKLVNRGYTKGFLLGYEPEHNFSGQQSDNDVQFVGEIIESDGKELVAKIHNALRKEEKVEIITKEKNIPIRILSIRDEDGKEVESAHGGHGKLYHIKVNKKDIPPMALLRKIVK
jgi:putative protease